MPEACLAAHLALMILISDPVVGPYRVATSHGRCAIIVEFTLSGLVLNDEASFRKAQRAIGDDGKCGGNDAAGDRAVGSVVLQAVQDENSETSGVNPSAEGRESDQRDRGDADAAEHHGERLRKLDAPEALPWRHAETPCGFDQRGRHAA